MNATAPVIPYITREALARKIAGLPPHSRKRAPLEAVAMELTTAQLGFEVSAMFDAMERAFEEAAEEIASLEWSEEFRLTAGIT